MINQRSPMRRRFRPFLEMLESRQLLSASAIVPALAQVVPLGDINPLASSGSLVYTPAQIRHAYGFDKLPDNGQGQTIAIVDAYDSPTVYNDLQTFDRTFGISDPPSFVKAMPEGQPAVNSSWAGEIALDVQWAHAIAPMAKILLVEAKSSSTADLLGAVDYARHQSGVVAVSMSWGGGEFSTEASVDGYFTTPSGHIGGSGLSGGVTFVASSGDNGATYGPEWPATSPNVLAVGGTSLYLNSDNSWSVEPAWKGSGGGVSAYQPRPLFQRDAFSNSRRGSPDVAYNADPGTGFYVYNSTPDNGYTGWFSFGGTSAGAPQWAALVALADQGRALAGHGSLTNTQSLVYSLSSSDFHDVTRGSNGYAAGVGYDLVSGLGSPFADRVVTDLIASSSGIVSSYSGARFMPSTRTQRAESGPTSGGTAGSDTATTDALMLTLKAASFSPWAKQTGAMGSTPLATEPEITRWLKADAATAAAVITSIPEFRASTEGDNQSIEISATGENPTFDEVRVEVQTSGN